MDKINAQLQGKTWIPFKDIPAIAKMIYDIQLEVSLSGLKEYLQKYDRAYETACEYWFNNTHDGCKNAVRKDSPETQA